MLHEQIRFHRGLLLALAVFGAGCASSGDAPEVVPGRAPLVDPASGRIEEIPDTELPVPVQLAPELTGERQQAAERLSAVVARLGTRDDARSGPFPFDGLSGMRSCASGSPTGTCSPATAPRPRIGARSVPPHTRSNSSVGSVRRSDLRRCKTRPSSSSTGARSVLLR